MKALRYILKIVLLSIVLAGSLVISRLVLYQLGLNLPRFPQQAEESIAIYYLLAGSIILAMGFFAVIRGISGSYKLKFLLILLFTIFGFSIGVTIESAIYSDVPSYNLTIIVLLLPVFLFSLIAPLLTENRHLKDSFSYRMKEYFKLWPVKIWIRNILLAIISFPVIYFIFGLAVSPFVSAYYHEMVEGLKLPGPGKIILIQFIRSTIFLIITIPVIVYWSGSKTKLILSLGLAHFVMVFAYDLYLAILVPVELIIIHGIEIAADSFLYSWVMVALLYPKTNVLYE